MAIQKTIFSLFISLIISSTGFTSASRDVPHTISISPSHFSGAIPPQLPIGFPPSLPYLPPPIPLIPLIPIASPPFQPSCPPPSDLPSPVPSSSSPSQSAPPQLPIASPPFQPSYPPSSDLPSPMPSSSSPSQSAPPQMPIASPPFQPSYPPSSDLPSPVPSSSPPSQSAPPPMPIAWPPSMPPFPVVKPLPPPPSSSPPPRGIKGAYWPSWLEQGLPPSSIPTPYFTHAFYAFLLVDPTSFQVSITQFDEQWMMNFTSTLHYASPPAKAILSIGGAGASPEIFPNMVNNLDNRAAFIQSSIDAARKYNFDGLDLDWEFPTDPQNMSNLALLYKEWRAAINHDSLASYKPRLLLSSAVYFASTFFLPGDVPRAYPGDAIRTYVDFLNPMCYDYHGGWDPSATGAHALLYDKTSNLSTSYGISTWKGDGVPSNKIVMGMPVYGKTWQLKDPNEHGIGDPAVGTGPGGGTMIYSAILEFNSENNATVVFDNATVSTYSYAGTNWIGYDDITSVEYKVKFANAQGLGGYFFWALGFDSNWNLARAASMAWDSAN